MKKLISIILTIAMILTLLPATVWADTSVTGLQGKGTAADPYKIGTLAELEYMASKVSTNSKINTGDAVNSAYAAYILTADIGVDNAGLSNPIGGNGGQNFNGTFNGDGHTVWLSIDSSATDLGLFGVIGSAGEVKNVTTAGVVQDSSNTEDSSNRHIGGVCGCCYNKITNCINRATISAKKGAGAIKNYVAGICGVLTESGNIDGCVNIGAISKGNTVCGICGYNNGSITNCVNRGTIDTTGTEYSNSINCGTKNELSNGALTAWSTNNSLPTTTGSYYLTTNVTLTSACTLGSGVNIKLDLNGYTISGNNSFCIINIEGDKTNKATLTLYDSDSQNRGTIKNGSVSNAWSGGGVRINCGAFNMYGGTITNCKTTSTTGGAGGVYIGGYGTFNMYGGAITNCSSVLNGGGVYVADNGNDAGRFNMSGGIIDNCTASKKGGGVYLAGGSTIASFNMTNGTISNCTAQEEQGGGVYVGEGDVDGAIFTMSGGNITNCTTSTDKGAGIYVSTNADCTLSGNAKIDNCTAKRYGGGVQCYGNLSISDNVIIENCTASTEGGGGVSFDGFHHGSVTMTGGTITNCSAATNGGGILFYKNPNGTVTLGGNAKIIGNTVNSQADNLYLAKDRKITLATGNSAPAEGMSVGITLASDYGTGSPFSGTINPDYFTSDNPAESFNDNGAIAHSINGVEFTPWTTNSSLPTTAGSYYLATDVTISSTWKAEQESINLDLNGHVINLNEQRIDVYAKTFNLYDSLNKGIIKNGKNDHGGAFWIDGGCTLNMYGGTIDSCKATDKYGGGAISIKSGAFFNMYGGTISNCQATYSTGNGGAIFNEGTFDMKGGIIKNCTAPKYGGAILINGGTMTMSGGEISGNYSGDGGGGICIGKPSSDSPSGGTLTMTGGSISGNTAKNDGGGVCIASGSGKKSTFSMSNGTISNNKATDGAGVLVGGSATSEFTMTGGTITKNSAEKVDSSSRTICGGGVCNQKTFNMTGGTISENTSSAADSGAGVYNNKGSLSVGGNAKIENNKANGKLNNLTTSSSTKSTTFSGGAGTEASPYLISDNEDLSNLAKNVNGGETYNGKYFKVTNDITYIGLNSSKEYETIGRYPEETGKTAYAFSGIFDGGNHTITMKLTVNNPDKSCGGLFAYVYKGTVKNVILDGAVRTHSWYGAALVSRLIDSIVENCVNKASVNEGYTTGRYSGGICSILDNSTIRNCINNGAITGTRGVGGIVGQINSNGGVIENCFNTGAINVTGTVGDTAVGWYSGGICGYVANLGDNKVAKIENCYSNAVVTALNGGAAGDIGYKADKVEVSNVYFNSDKAPQTGVGEGHPAEDFTNGTIYDLLNDGATADNGYRYWAADGSFKAPDVVLYKVSASVNNENAGSLTTSPTHYEAGDVVTLTRTVNEGYQFIEYRVTGIQASSIVDGKFTMPTSDVSIEAVIAKTTSTITYLDTDGTAFSGTHDSGHPTTHTYGTATTLKSASVTGYIFEGWYTTEECDGAAVTSLGATDVLDDIKLYAKLTPCVAVPTAETGLVYTGQVLTGVVAGTGYTLTDNTATNAGSYTATATLSEGYKWADGTTDAKTIDWSIAKKNISGATVGDFASLTYSGDAQTPSATVTIDGLTATGTWSDVTNVADKTTFTANGNFDGSIADQSTGMAKGVAPAAPTGLEGVDPTSYGGSDGKITGTTTLMEYSTSSDFGTKTTCTGTEITGLSAGTYYVRLAETDNVNASEYATVIISDGAKENFSITITDYDAEYDGETHSITLTGVPEDATVKYGASDATYDKDSITYKDFTDGAQTIYVKVTKEGFNDFTGSGTVTISRKAATVTADNLSKTYGATDPTLTATVDGTIGTDTLTYTVSRAEGENVGTYTITPAGEAEQGNYSVTYTTGTFTISKKSVDAPAAVTGLTYNGQSQTGVEEGEGYTVNNGSATNAGDYTATATLADGYIWSDDTTDAKTINWSIAKDVPNLVTYPLPAAITYGQTLADSVLSGGSTNVVGSFKWNNSAAAPTVSDSDSTNYTVEFNPTDTTNYQTAYLTVNVHVNKAALTVTAKDKSIAYGESAANDGVEFSGFVHNETESVLGGALSYAYKVSDLTTDYTTSSPVGSYVIIPSGLTSDNYDITFVNGTLTVDKAEQTITANETQSFTFGDTGKSVTATAEGTLSYAVKSGDSVTVDSSTGALTIVKSGDTVITITAAETDSYNSATKDITISIGNSSITKPTEDTNSFTYTGSELTYTPANFDDSTMNISGNKQTNANTTGYTVTVTPKDGYAWSNGGDCTFTWIVAAAELTEATAASQVFTGKELTPVVTAKAGELDATFEVGTWSGEHKNVGTYTATVTGTGNFTGSVQVTFEITSSGVNVPTAVTGLVYDETEKTGVEEGTGYTLTDNTATNAGDYTATATLSEGYKWADGTTDAKTINWSIAKADVTAPTGLEGVKPTSYGGSDGKITGTTVDMEYSASTNFEAKTTCSATETTGLSAGIYYVRLAETDNYNASAYATVTVPEGDATDFNITITNYNAAYDGEAHSITLTGVPADATVAYGTSNGTYDKDSITYKDFTNGAQTIYVKVTKEGFNDFTGSGTVTISRKAVTVTADNKSKVVGEDDPELTATITGMVGSDKLEYTVTRAEGDTVGTYTITPAGEAEQGNYSVTYTTGTFTITEVTEHSHSFTYTVSDNVLTATCSNSDGKCDLTNQKVTLTLTAPSNLVADNTAKEARFALGESTAWLAAGLTLPTIYYEAEGDSQVSPDEKAVDSGVYFAKITVDTVTASLRFEISTKKVDDIVDVPSEVEVEDGKIKSDGKAVDVKDSDNKLVTDERLIAVANAINRVLSNPAVQDYATNLDSATSRVTATPKILNVELVAADIDNNIVVTGMTFDFTPMANGVKIENANISGYVTLRMPIDSSVTEDTVAVKHEDELLGTYEIQNSEGNKYVEIQTNSFSPFSYYVLNAGNAVAETNSTYYASLSDAVSKVQDNGTITLLKGASDTITVSRKVTFTITGINNNATIKAGFGYTVEETADGNSKTYTVTRSGIDIPDIDEETLKKLAVGAAVVGAVAVGTAVAVGAANAIADANEADTPVEPEVCLRDYNCPLYQYGDLDMNAWYHDGIEYTLNNGLMNGVGSAKFDPNGKTTRPMMMVILARMAGIDTSTGSEWDSVGKSWAKNNGISAGIAEEGNITREEFATMLYRYAKMQGDGFTGDWMFLLDYKDADQISSFANEAVHWCVMKGILNGRSGLYEGMLDPQGELTRAEAAAMIQRFMER